MTDQELNSIKEKISKAYLYSLAAKLNYSIQEFNKDFDGCGLDFGVINKKVGLKRSIASENSQINIQLKSVSLSSDSMIKEESNCISYNLSTSIENFGINTFLCLVIIPKEDDIESWITLTEDQIILRKCAYFFPIPKEGLSTGKIKIPKENILTQESFPRLFNNISKDNY